MLQRFHTAIAKGHKLTAVHVHRMKRRGAAYKLSIWPVSQACDNACLAGVAFRLNLYATNSLLMLALMLWQILEAWLCLGSILAACQLGSVYSRRFILLIAGAGPIVSSKLDVTCTRQVDAVESATKQ